MAHRPDLDLASYDSRERSSLRVVLLYVYIGVGLVTLVVAPLVSWIMLAGGAVASLSGFGVTRNERIALGVYTALGLTVIALVWLLLMPAGVRFEEGNVVELIMPTR